MPEQPVGAVSLETDLGLFQVGLVSRPVRPEIASIIVIFGAVHPVTVSFIIKAHHEVMGHADGLTGIDFEMQGRLHGLGHQEQPQGKASGRKPQAQSDASQFL
jgi:hypothetical protein